MNQIATMYNLLGIRQKLQDQKLRILYLRDVWGLSQALIGECEGIKSQSNTSRLIKEAQMYYGTTDIKNTAAIQFQPEEIKYIQMLPRTIINDTQIIAFVNNILGINVVHPFYSVFNHNANVRIAALSDLGIRNKQLQIIFKKTQPSISMIIKRNIQRSREIERVSRYDQTALFRIEPQVYKQSFIMAGGN